jgi:hypothetical protein
MKGANPAVCDRRHRLLGDEIVNRLPGGWHALLGLDVTTKSTHVYVENELGGARDAHGRADDARGPDGSPLHGSVAYAS